MANDSVLKPVDDNKSYEVRIDRDFLLRMLEKFVNTPSPVGFYEFGNPALREVAAELDVECFEDERHCLYMALPGEDEARTVLVGAHMDTLGYLVRCINNDGSISVKQLGGMNQNSVEHDTCYLFTRDLKKYTGYMTLVHHSVHVYDDAREMPREDKNMRFMLDEDVASAEDVRALGIEVGDIIAPEPHFTIAPNGRIRSRFLDNKAAVAIALTVIKYLRDNNLKPRYRTLFAFPYYEEVNAGGSYVPAEVREYVGIDIGVIGPDNRGTERSVSIVAGDRLFNYDRELTGQLIAYAKQLGIPYSVELFHRYSTDAMCSFFHGNNLKHAAFGMTVYSSHGVERTFDSSLIATAELALTYVLRE